MHLTMFASLFALSLLATPGAEAGARAGQQSSAAAERSDARAAAARAQAQAAQRARDARAGADHRARQRAQDARAQSARHAQAAQRAQAKRAQAQAAKRAQVKRAQAQAAQRAQAKRARIIRARSARPHGVFVYAPPRARAAAPTRTVDRSGAFSLGLQGGSYLGAYEQGGGFADPGLGIVTRYRASDAVGLELSFSQYGGGFGERTATPILASVQFFAFPWTRVNPYASLGMSWTSTSFTYLDGDGGFDGGRFGPQAGLGLEVGLGSRTAINLDSRVMGAAATSSQDPTSPVSVQTSLGLHFYF